MNSITPRGIQYEDVALAADALLQEGLRPTIERIRQRIGRGSPNTVSPMLERWFSGLGERIHGRTTSAPRDDDLPAAVWQAVEEGWRLACKQAQQQAAEAYATDRDRLTTQTQQLVQDRIQLDAREHSLNERLQAMEASLQLCTQQLQESNERWKASQRNLAQREEEMTAQRHLLAQVTTQNAGLQQHLEAVQAQATAERQTAEERHQSNERRWMAEVDRARQQAKQAAQQIQEQERQCTLLQTRWEQMQAKRQQEAQEHFVQLDKLRQELTQAQSQATQATTLLEQWQNQRVMAPKQAGRQLVARPLRSLRQNLINKKIL